MSVDTGKELFRLGFLTAIEVPDRGYIGGLLVTNHFGRPLEFQCTAPLKPNRTQEILYGPTLVPYVLGDLIGRTLIEKVGVKPHIVLTEREELLGLRDLVEIPVACVDDLPESGQTDSAVTGASVCDESSAADDEADLVPTEEPIAVIERPTDESADISPDVQQSVLEASIPEPALDLSQPHAEPAASGDAPVTAPITKANFTLSAQETPEPNRQSGGSRSNESLDDCPAIQLGRQVLRFHAGHSNDRSVASRGARVVPSNADLREPFERVREALGETARLGGAR
ncbi:MAG TPA: hypothetical protein VGP76_25140 [Planctomycetaceae bacterium]|jgi:hypothetical protein|nr:hypothetical protein [Planctomycetaceae bacterium]